MLVCVDCLVCGFSVLIAFCIWVQRVDSAFLVILLIIFSLGRW